MRKVIGITGYAQSGKDASALILRDVGYDRIAFADKVREALYLLNPWIFYFDEDSMQHTAKRLQWIIDSWGWDEAKVKFKEVRELQQRMGTEVGRNLFWPEFWIGLAITEIDKRGLEDVVIPDVRFKEEVDWIHDHRGIVIRIRRPGVDPVNDHISDTGIDSLDVDWYVDNNGTLDDLRRNITELARTS